MEQLVAGSTAQGAWQDVMPLQFWLDAAMQPHGAAIDPMNCAWLWPYLPKGGSAFASAWQSSTLSPVLHFSAQRPNGPTLVLGLQTWLMLSTLLLLAKRHLCGLVSACCLHLGISHANCNPCPIHRHHMTPHVLTGAGSPLCPTPASRVHQGWPRAVPSHQRLPGRCLTLGPNGHEQGCK